MRMKTLLLTFVCLACAAPAEAGTTWIGGQLDFPVPGRDVGDAQLGVGAGATFTHMLNAYVGIGGDLVYHYWPASSEYEGAFDRYLRTERLEALEGSEWALSARQVTGHIRLAAPISRRCAPWVQVGGGTYRLNFNLDERRPAGTYAWVVGPSMSSIRDVGGAYVGAGIDLLTPPVALGMDATLHYVWSGRKSTWGWDGINDLPDFAAFTAGVHVAWGWN